MPSRRKPPRRPRVSWVRYVVPVQAAATDPSRPVDVYAPEGDPMRAAVCATIIAFLGQPGSRH